VAGHVVRVEVQSDQLVIELANAKGADPKRKRSRNVIEVPWHKTPSTRRREALVPEAGPPQDARPIRSENRAILVEDQDEYAQSFISGTVFSLSSPALTPTRQPHRPLLLDEHLAQANRCLGGES
jgi:hypothetical protein